MLLNAAASSEVQEHQEPEGGLPSGGNVTVASSSRVQLAPSEPELTTGTELDKHDLIRLTVMREPNRNLGLALSQSVNKPSRSASRSSSKSDKRSKSKKSKKEES